MHRVHSKDVDKQIINRHAIKPCKRGCRTLLVTMENRNGKYIYE